MQLIKDKEEVLKLNKKIFNYRVNKSMNEADTSKLNLHSYFK